MNFATELSEYLRRIGKRLRGGDWQRVLATREPPLRAELFSTEQMEEHGRALAARHRLTRKRGHDSLLARLAANESALLRVCAALTKAVGAKRRITPAGEWLLDNFYLIEEQVRIAKRHLPKRYSRELPRLAVGTMASSTGVGPPRVYDIAREIVAHGDGRVDTEVLSRFIAAYQSVAPLTLGELWATPIMLRLAVIENLRRVGVAIAANRSDQNLADLWADQLTQVADSDPKSLIIVIADMARSNPPLVSAFVAEFARRLHGRGPALALPLSWIEQQLAESGQTIEHLIQLESQQQATDQVSVSNSIGSLRLLGAVNWREFVESLSVVEQTLREDPDDVYSRMDFATRDRYRHAAETLATKSRHGEGEVARAVLSLARDAAGIPSAGGERERHVGFYLVDEGRSRLEAAIAYLPPWPERLRRRAARQPLLLYLAPVLGLSVALTLVMLDHSGLPLPALAVFAVLWLLAASQSALALVNWFAGLVVTPQLLPRMDFAEGLPPSARTLVVVPTLLTSHASVASLLEALEVRFLANRDARLHYGLLTDFTDAASASLPGDDELVAQAARGIDELNRKYRGSVDEVWDDIFFLFHRPRVWNSREGVWMGYERKRGKLAALNALLRSGSSDAFALIVGDTALLSSVKYVITLDTDTQLPRDAARQFVGAMAHPLNRPRYDKTLQRVVDGYGILQPRVDSSLPGANRSRYARLFGGEPGIDPYTRAVSDLYQDAFGEGSFIGKGIYEVDAFEQALAGRFPENLILSHDLIEGCYARSGLLSDVSLFEGYPASYLADVARRHRWIRGDWQIAAWLLPRVPAGVAQGRQRNPLSLLAQWKIFDNLRRSLVAAALCLLLIGAWLWLPAAPVWTLTVIAMLLLPALLASAVELLRWPAQSLPRQHLAAVGKTTSRRLEQLAFAFSTLPFEAFYSVGAILRTLWRMLIRKRGLLEWNPASESEAATSALSGSLVSFVRVMWFAPAAAFVLGVIVAEQRPALLLCAAPILLLWFISPFIAFRLSRPLVAREVVLGDQQRLFLHRLARRIWGFFDQFVTSEDNWLPPDNFQTYRIAAVAHRTSPTNIGLALLANLSAYDFAYITLASLIERTSNSFTTLARLERHRGHFYNWYDTQTLQPLLPLYVSTVDSGNLAAHLLTLRAGLVAVADEPVFGSRAYAGLNDTLAILYEISSGVAAPALKKCLADFRLTLLAAWSLPPHSLAVAARSLHALVGSAARLVAASAAAADAAVGPAPESDGKGSEKTAADAQRWAQELARQCAASFDELQRLAPWLALAGASAGDADAAGGRREVDPLELDTPIPSLRTLAALAEASAPRFAAALAAAPIDAQRMRLEALQQSVAAASAEARARIEALEALARQARDFAEADYDFLYDRGRHLLTIGYNVSDHRRDAGYYDLLASEARLCSFVAIAQGQLPQESWFSLGRLLAGDGGDPVLLSWTGSMFEYLMPLLVMPTFDETLLDQTYHAAVAKQIEYGAQRGVAWGMSESGYNTVDLHFNYQYRAFGVPGLGLKRGLAEDLVVAPYASVMALMVAPEKACANLQRLDSEGFLGRFGFFEAIDYTPSRQRRGRPYATVLSYMAHHQAMSLLALAYLLLDRPMQKRFAADPQFQAVMPLLQERVPRASAVFSRKLQMSAVRPMAEEAAQTPIRVFTSPDTLTPEVQLLSNGRYHVMVSNAGGGYSRWRDLAVTRWREDASCDQWGSFCYLRELAVGKEHGEAPPFWSTAYQPTLKKPESYEAIFSEGRAEFRRRDAVASGLEDNGRSGYFETHSEIVVSPEDDIELRRTRITNRSRVRREIEITTYAEVVIAPAVSDTLHPAFSNLFVHSELVAERHALLCTRRPRAHGEATPTLLHLLVVHGAEALEFSYETDRARFIGRCRTGAAPQALAAVGPLSGSVGPVLDPIVAIRCRVVLDAEQVATFDVVTGMTETRDAALALVGKYQDRHLADRVFDLAWTHSQVVLRQLNASEDGVQLYARLAASVLYADASLRPDPAILLRNRRGQSGLWGYAISGDLPIVLLRIGDASNIELVRQLVEAHAYWRLKGLAVDLVIWNEDHASYRQHLQDEIVGLIASGIEASLIDRPGGIFVRLGALIAGEDRVLFQSVARAVITDERGTLEQQLNDRRLSEPRQPWLRAIRRPPAEAAGDGLGASAALAAAARRDLVLDNGSGGFSKDGSEYVIVLGDGEATPAPWVNVLANAQFGSVVSESGMAYSWCENAHEFRLTPWHNDPISDAGGEALYLRDEESGRFWSPTPLPARAPGHYVVRHGFGYSVFITSANGIYSELWVYVALDAPVKFSLLKLRNESGRPRKLSATAYVEWVLGDLRAKSAMHIATEIDVRNGALYARNAYNTEFPERVGFLDVDDRTRSFSGDRTEFLGRNGTLANPAAMRRTRLSGKVGAALDPCGAMQLLFDLGDGEEHELVFRLGGAANSDAAGQVVQRFRGLFMARATLQSVREFWQRTLGAVQVSTPDPAADMLANGWLIYQVLACRFWARSGYYQSGGAFGFRDQLQDAMALVHATPWLLRDQLLLCASRQFVEGDVQHWWHPPAGRGVRTHCSDDYLWLPLAIARYVRATADTGVLDATAPFLEGRPVPAGEESYYDLPGVASERASLYEHGVRSIRHGLRYGERGLPLIGSGDWNDGMNRVGIDGRGESVWLAFFLCAVLREYAELARAYGDAPFADFCVGEDARLRANIEQHAWDGAWYRRAWFDDGTPLGAHDNLECRIDSIAQSWSVLSAVGGEKPAADARARTAMRSLDENLVRRDARLVQLLDPPFDKTPLDPGYIRGYLPGVRENGGQYTHAAVWAAMAFAALGENDLAWELLGLINPLHHARTPADVVVYKVEPYVIAADVYARAPHTGRGGWSWYTGSAGWAYRLIVESLLGLRLAGTSLHLDPCVPRAWPGYAIAYRYRTALYRISVTQQPGSEPVAVRSVLVDGVAQADLSIPLADDRREHVVEVELM